MLHRVARFLEYVTPTWFIILNLGFVLIGLIMGSIIPQGLTEETYILAMPRASAWILALGWNDLYGSVLFHILLACLGLQFALLSLKRIIIAWTSSPDSTSSQDQLRLGCCMITAYAPALTLAGLALICVALVISHLPPNNTQGHKRMLSGDTLCLPTSQGEIELKLQDFTIESDGQGHANAFISQLQVSTSTTSEVHQLGVNAPLHCQGWNIYQSGYGVHSFELIFRHRGQNYTAVISTGPGGELTPSLPLISVPFQPNCRYVVHRFYPHAQLEGDRILSHSTLPDRPAALIFELRDLPSATTVEAAKEGQSVSFRRLGWLRSDEELHDSQGTSLKLGKMTLFSELRYKRDSGFYPFVLGMLLILAGLLTSALKKGKEQ